jgi:hypothetical protein
MFKFNGAVSFQIYCDAMKAMLQMKKLTSTSWKRAYAG